MSDLTVKYEKGSLQIDIYQLLQAMDEKSKIAFIESLACDDAVIKHVTDQILEGWTESGCHGSQLCTASPQAYHGIDRAWRQVAKRSDEVAKKEIERLEDALRRKSQELQESHEVNQSLRESLRNYR